MINMDYNFISIRYKVFSHILLRAMNDLQNTYLMRVYNATDNCFIITASLSSDFIMQIMKEKSKSYLSINMALIQSKQDIENSLKNIRKILNEFQKSGFDIYNFFDDEKVLLLANKHFANVIDKQEDVINFMVETSLIKMFNPTVKLDDWCVEGTDILVADNDIEYIDGDEWN